MKRFLYLAHFGLLNITAENVGQACDKLREMGFYPKVSDVMEL